MDIQNLFALLGGLSPIVVFSVMGLALFVFLAGAALAVQAFRSASQSREAFADAKTRLSMANDLADEVRILRAQVEQAVAHHDAAVASARTLHNEACAAVHGAPVAAVPALKPHDDDDDDHHHKHHSLKPHDDDDDDHHKHHALKPHDDDDDDHHKKHHQGFRGMLFRRANGR